MNKNILVLGFFLLSTSGCMAPIVVGGSAAVGTMAVKEKGIGGTISDSEISLKIKKRFYSYDSNLHAHVGVNVQLGDVLLTGSVPKEDWITKAESLCKEVVGVKKVFNYLTVMKNPNSLSEKVSSVPKDSWITTKVKSIFLFDGKINSLNYSVKTVDSVVYIMGVAKSQDELDHILKRASEIDGVQKVINLVNLVETQDQSLSAQADLPEDTAVSEDEQG